MADKSAPKQPKQENYPNLNKGGPGRYSKYKDSIIQEVDKYLESIANSKDEFPTIEGFAEYVGVVDATLYAWANKKLKNEKGELTKKHARPEFLNALKRIKMLQKKVLITAGFFGGKEVNAAMGIFLLKANHGMKETTYIDHTTKGDKLPAPTPLLGGKSDVPVDNGDK